MVFRFGCMTQVGLEGSVEFHLHLLEHVLTELVKTDYMPNQSTVIVPICAFNF